MSTDIATLGLAIRSDGVVVANDRLERLERQSRRNERASEQLVSRFRDLSQAAVAAAGAFAAMASALSINAYLEYEEALTEVQKQTDLTGKALDKFKAKIDAASAKLPGTSTDLLNIVASAGQVGVTGVDNLLKFATVISKIPVASDLAAGEATQYFAKLLNATKESYSNIDKVAAVTVKLGGASLSGEKALLSFASVLGRISTIVPLTSDQVQALTATMVDLSIPPDLATGVMTRSFLSLKNVISEGGQAAKLLSELTGVAVEDLQKELNQNAAGFFVKFLEGLDAVEKQTGRSIEALEKFGIKGTEELSVLPPLISNVDKLKTYFGLASDEMKKATALTDEYNRRADDLGVVIKTAGERLNRLGVLIVENYTGPLMGAATATNQFITVLIDNVDTLIAVLNKLLVIGTVAASIRAMGLAASVASALLAGLSGAALSASVAFTTLGGAISAAALAVGAFTAGRALVENFALVEVAAEHVAVFIADVFEGAKAIFDRVATYIETRLLKLNAFILDKMAGLLKSVASLGNVSFFGKKLFDTSSLDKWAQGLQEGANYSRALVKENEALIKSQGNLIDALKDVHKANMQRLETMLVIIDKERAAKDAGIDRAKAEDKLKEANDKVTKAQEAQAKAAKELKDFLDALNGTKEDSVKVNTEEAQALSRITQLYNAYLDRVEPATAGQREFNRTMQALGPYLDKAAAKLGISADKLKEYIEAEIKARNTTQDFNQTLIQMPNIAQAAAYGIQNAFSDTFENIFRHGIDGFKGFFDSLYDLFLRLISQMLAAWASSGLLRMLGMGGASIGGMSAANASTGAGGVSFNLGSSGIMERFGGLVTRGAMGLGFSTDTAASMGAGVSSPWALGGGIVGTLGANMLFGGNRGVGAGIGGALGGIAGAAAGGVLTAALLPVLGPLAPIVGPLLGSLLGSFGGNFLGGLFGDGKHGKIKLRTSDTATGFDHGNTSFASSPFGMVGPGEKSHDLEELQQGLSNKLAAQVADFDKQVASFLTQTQIDAVSKALKTTDSLSINIGQKLKDSEFARVLADRAITILKTLDIAVPEILNKAVASESVSTDEVKVAIFKALIVGTVDLNKQLADLITNFQGTSEQLQQFATVVVSINQMLPALNAVFGKQDASIFVKAAQNMGGLQNFQQKLTEFSQFFGFAGDVSKANATELKKTMETQLKALHTTRETFLADFEKAKAGGLTAEELQKWVEAGLAIKHVVDAAAQLKDFMSGFKDELMKDSLSEFQYAMYQLNKSFDAAMKQAKDYGASTQELGIIQEVYHKRQQQLISNLENSIRSLVEQLFIQPELQSTTTKLNDINQKIKDTQGNISGASTEMGRIIAQHRLERLQKQKSDLETKQQQLQDRLQKQNDLGLAQKLAQQIADLSSARDISFSKIAQQFGFSLDDLAEKLGMSRGQLDDYLKGLQETNYTLPQLSDQFDKMLTPHFLALIKAVGGQPLPEDASAEEIGAQAYTRGMVNPDNSLIDVAYALHSGATDSLKSASTQLDASKNMKDSAQMAKDAADRMWDASRQIFQAAQEGKNITITIENAESAVGI